MRSPTPILRSITLAWDNHPEHYAQIYETGLEASPDLRHWQELLVLNYKTSVVVTVSNRPTPEFYRVFNRLKQ